MVPTGNAVLARDLGNLTGGRMFPTGGVRAALLALLACAACFMPAKRVSLARYEGQMLSTGQSSGIEAMIAINAVEPMKTWVAKEGQPDYVLVESPRSIRFFYVDSDRLVTFSKPFLGGELKPVASRPIRSDFYVDFSNRDRERLGRARMGAPPKEEPVRPGVVRKRVGETEGEGKSSDGPPR